jgi:hypothetical protein
VREGSVNIENVPGGHTSAADALQALTELSQMLVTARESLARLNRASADLERVISKFEGHRKNAVLAIELFAEVMPSSFAVPRNGVIDRARAELDEQTTQLLRDAAAIVEKAGGLS